MHAHVSHDLTDLFADLFGTDSPFADIFGWARRGQATTEKHASVITMDLPGRAKSDVSVKVKDRRITVEAKALKRKNSEGVEFYARPSVKESWRLSPGHLPEEITCTLKDGVLTIKVPTSQPTENPERTVPIG